MQKPPAPLFNFKRSINCGVTANMTIIFIISKDKYNKKKLQLITPEQVFQ